MKTSKFLLAAGLAALGFADSASAQTKIYITGAPATRVIWNTAITNVLTSLNGGVAPTIAADAGGAAYSTANQVTWTGATISVGGTPTPVTVKASWTGSTGGIQSVAATPPESNTNFKVKFLPDGASGLSAANPTTTGNANELAYPNFTLSDTIQATVPFNGHVTLTTPPSDYVTLDEASYGAGVTYPAITGFKFLANKGAPLTNITPLKVQKLFTVGTLPLAFFTGNESDEGTNVYAVGRDIASGARYILLAETGIGAANSSQLKQYYVNLSGSTVSSYSLSPANTINEITYPAGNGGYPSFSNVLTALKATSTPSVGYFVTYVTDTDADQSAIPNGAVELSWNGNHEGSGQGTYANSYSGTYEGSAPAPLAEGVYSYWSYLHVHYQKSFISANHPAAYTLANAVALDLATDTTTGAILTSDVGVSRNSDGGVISATYE